MNITYISYYNLELAFNNLSFSILDMKYKDSKSWDNLDSSIYELWESLYILIESLYN